MTTQEDRTPPRLGDELVELGLIERPSVEAAAAYAVSAGRRLGEVLLADMLVDEADLWLALAHQRDRPFQRADAWAGRVDKELLQRFSQPWLRSRLLLPIAVRGDRLEAVTCAPGLDLGMETLPIEVAGVDLVVTPPGDFARIWQELGLSPLSMVRSAAAVRRDEAMGGVAPEFDVDAANVKLFEAILADAFGERATDIHFETYGEHVRLRYRIDGDLVTVRKHEIDWRGLAGIVNLVKIHCNLDISERRRPQGGAMHRTIAGHVVDLRVQTQPTLFGENIVLRLLPQTTKRFSIDDLGFSLHIADRYRRMLDSPSGLILVVGPTGSGKTTTQYAALSLFARDETRKVITIEDPIEYVLTGIQQTQIHPTLGYTFANAMRVIVREDPDVVMLGEVRDPDTALETLRASQTGHLVLSTLHCNDTVDAVQRLLDLGMHANSIAAELLCVIAQRLAPRICPACRVEAEPEKELIRELFPDGKPAEFRHWKGAGCDRCGGRGTYGRVAVYEFLEAGADLRRAISQRGTGEDLRAVALAGGMAPLRDVLLAMVHAGIVPLAAARQVLLPERMRPDDPAVPFRSDPTAPDRRLL